MYARRIDAGCADPYTASACDWPTSMLKCTLAVARILQRRFITHFYPDGTVQGYVRHASVLGCDPMVGIKQKPSEGERSTRVCGEGDACTGGGSTSALYQYGLRKCMFLLLDKNGRSVCVA